jgi:RHS repeat-associated protein
VQTGFDANGNVAAILLPHGNGVTNTYNSRDQRLMRTDALGQVEKWTYDTLDRVKTYTDRRNRVTTYDYDALGRSTTTTFPSTGGTITASYDAGNRLTSLADSLSGTLGWTYDSFDQVSAANSPQGTINYTYDAVGRRTGMQAAAQTEVQYGYDNADRLTGITQGTEAVTFAYDNANRLTTQTLPNQVQTVYTYNNADQVTGMAWGKAGQTALGSLGYGYDSSGQLVAQTGTHAPQALPQASTNNTFDDNNRQTKANNVAQVYDLNGNLTSDGSRTYVWDDRDRLSQIKQGTTVIASFSYDALGRRTARTEGGTSTSYLYDGLNAVQEIQGSAVNPILTGLGVDQRYARNDNGGRTYLLTDMLGSTRVLTNAAGAALQRYDYDPYGNTTQSSTAYTNPYQYTGRERDQTGLYYYRARYYQPAWVRFIAEDPLQLNAGPNSYAYVEGNPVTLVDPLGLQRAPSRPGGGNAQQRAQWNQAQVRAIQRNSHTTPINAQGLTPENIASAENLASIATGIDYTQYCSVAICRSDSKQCKAGDVTRNWIPASPTVAQVNALGCSCVDPHYADDSIVQEPSAGPEDWVDIGLKIAEGVLSRGKKKP